MHDTVSVCLCVSLFVCFCVAARHCMFMYDRVCVFVCECVWVCVLLRIGIVWLCMNLDLERRDIRPSKQYTFSICPFIGVNKGNIHN